jgi:hypothetical protein
MTATHPTPWRVTDPVLSSTVIYDADGALVETVYGRGGDLRGATLAQRIVDAVNGVARTGCGDPDCSCPECPTGKENEVAT